MYLICGCVLCFTGLYELLNAITAPRGTLMSCAQKLVKIDWARRAGAFFHRAARPGTEYNLPPHVRVCALSVWLQASAMRWN